MQHKKAGHTDVKCSAKDARTIGKQDVPSGKEHEMTRLPQVLSKMLGHHHFSSHWNSIQKKIVVAQGLFVSIVHMLLHVVAPSGETVMQVFKR